MSKLKLMTVVGTRPEIIRLSEVIKCADRYFEHILVHTGQNYDYELNRIFFEDLGLREPDFCLDCAGGDLGETIGNIIDRSYKLLVKQRPDALLILGDTNSCLCAISAKRLHVPIFHMEAGNRCFDECLPEETNRSIIDHIADVNLCYSEHARRYLNAEGRPRERSFVTGSPMAEVLTVNLNKIKSSSVLERLGLEKGKYILLSAHREENIDSEKNFFSLMNAVNAMAERYDMPILYSCHPRSASFIKRRGFAFDRRVIRHKPLGFHDYNYLQLNAYAVVSDSGTLPEESAYFASIGLPFPAICIRTSTERPEALEKGNFVLAGIIAPQVLQAVDLAVEMQKNGVPVSEVPDYSELNVSGKVIKIIQSYTGIVDRMVEEVLISPSEAYSPHPKVDNDMKRQKAFLIIDILLLIITLAFIWLSSLESASESAEKSEGLLIAIAPILELFLSADRINEHMIRKLAHFIEFALLGGELILLCVIDRRTRPQQVINCLSASLAVAVIDEALQLLSDRGPQITDVLLDFSGAVFGILFVLLIYVLVRMKKHRKQV